MKRLLFKSLCLSLALTYTAVFVLHDASFAMHSGSTDSVSAFSGNLLQAQAIQSFQPDLFTGQARTAVPLFVPPGRRGMQPSLALSYSSGGGNGWVGVGWGLDMGFIQRSTKKGRPQYNGSDTFVFSFQGVQSELVSIGSGEYRAKEEGLFLKFAYDGSSWTVWDKNGTRYFFGASSVSRIENASGTFEWCLDRVTDIHGNYMTFTYQKEPAQIYLYQIDYTGHETAPVESTTHSVLFLREPRPDQPISDTSGYPIKTDRRLKQIDVKVGPDLAHRYLLSYHQSSRTGRTILDTITEYGSDGTTSLPPMRFFYQETDDTTFSFMTNTNAQTGNNLWNIRTAGVDLFHSNESYLLPSGVFVGACSNGTGNGAQLTWGSTYTQPSGSANGVNWSMNTSTGELNVTGGADTHFHAWTYVYVATARTVSIPLGGGFWAAFHNGTLVRHACNRLWAGVDINLVAGWNLIELTGYNQNSG